MTANWAWQKGQQHFGTILVDLERRAVVDVLGVRTADAVASWLTDRERGVEPRAENS